MNGKELRNLDALVHELHYEGARVERIIIAPKEDTLSEDHHEVGLTIAPSVSWAADGRTIFELRYTTDSPAIDFDVRVLALYRCDSVSVFPADLLWEFFATVAVYSLYELSQRVRDSLNPVLLMALDFLPPIDEIIVVLQDAKERAKPVIMTRV